MPRYTISITGEDGRSVAFPCESHDDLFAILSRAGDEAELRRIAGIKLFGQVLLEHKGDPAFAGLAREFGLFMRELKKRPRD